ncbi:hypothetical protein LPTSP3_g34160 [Leptospira kobayashii]|uniref:Uncharacterized protein n=1 Tax=Leptospira kobayashii TaxID=1917830 RepID=A0ABN6KKM4_9LEPT|nr:hypothetical protein [Leptospira kobayashii]BDA80486.1 hypothetical protein LPTSP3_g34160 [Leptospira kobayashii]
MKIVSGKIFKNREDKIKNPGGIQSVLYSIPGINPSNTFVVRWPVLAKAWAGEKNKTSSGQNGGIEVLCVKK